MRCHTPSSRTHLNSEGRIMRNVRKSRAISLAAAACSDWLDPAGPRLRSPGPARRRKPPASVTRKHGGVGHHHTELGQRQRSDDLRGRG